MEQRLMHEWHVILAAGFVVGLLPGALIGALLTIAIAGRNGFTGIR